MSSYIGKVQIGEGTPVLVGSTLYGICNRDADAAAKTVTSQDTVRTDCINTNYDQLLVGTTIHVKFLKGNTATSNLTLQVGTVATAQNITGDCTCPAGTVLSFTLDENQNWVVNDNVDTNTEYVFKSAYNASTNRVLGEADVGDAAEKDVVISLSDSDNTTPNNDLPTASAVVAYVLDKTAGLSGLTGAMHFKGTTTTTMSDGLSTRTVVINGNNYSAEPGDVVLSGTNQEYVWTETDTINHIGYWELLGDEGSYVLQTSQTTGSVGSASLGTSIAVDDITGWDDGSPSNAVVANGILTLTNSVVPILNFTARTIPSVSVTSTNVIVPVTNP